MDWSPRRRASRGAPPAGQRPRTSPTIRAEVEGPTSRHAEQLLELAPRIPDPGPEHRPDPPREPGAGRSGGSGGGRGGLPVAGRRSGPRPPVGGVGPAELGVVADRTYAEDDEDHDEAHDDGDDEFHGGRGYRTASGAGPRRSRRPHPRCRPPPARRSAGRGPWRCPPWPSTPRTSSRRPPSCAFGA